MSDENKIRQDVDVLISRADAIAEQLDKIQALLDGKDTEADGIQQWDYRELREMLDKWDRAHQVVLSPWMREQIADWFAKHADLATRQKFFEYLRCLKADAAQSDPTPYMSADKPDAPSTSVDTRAIWEGSPKVTESVGKSRAPGITPDDIWPEEIERLRQERVD